MRLGGLTIAHALVACVTLGCVTLLGILDKLTEGTLSSLLSVIVGAVFGAAISQAGTNGAVRQVAEVAIEHGADARALDSAAEGGHHRRKGDH